MDATIKSRERILRSLEHKEPDRVGYDLGGSHVSGIHVGAYRGLCDYLGIAAEPVVFADVIQQVVVPGKAMLERLEVDTRGLYPLTSSNWNVAGKDAGAYEEYIDEWGFTHHKAKAGGLYWSLVKSPLDGAVLEPEDIERHRWPDAEDARRLAGLRDVAMRYRQEGKIVMMKGLCAGIFEMAQRVRGMENILCDLVAEPEKAGVLLDKLTELKCRFWEGALAELGDVVDVVVEGDDYGTQESQLISYATFRAMIYPRLKRLLETIKAAIAKKKAAGEKGYVFFHSCGNVRPFIGDFIDLGVNILNPVHISAAGMEPKALKRDYGKHLTFWGGGVETQQVLSRGTAAEVKEDVRRNVEALMPDGGYVFNTVHNIQAEVKAENIMAMWEAMREFGRYA